MDTLHPVTANEQWLAQGEYNYQVAGKDSGLKETWSLHTGPGSEVIHRASMGGSIAGTNLQQTSHLVMSAAFQPLWLEMSQDINGQLAHTRLACAPTGVRQTITTQSYEPNAGTNTTAEIEVAAPEGYRLFFPPVSAQGLIAQSYNLAAGGKQTLHLVSIRIQPQDALPLSLETQAVAYEYIDQHDVETPAGQFCCRHFIRYDQHMQQDLWFDEHWITVQWSVPYTEIMKWEYLLTRYQRK